MAKLNFTFDAPYDEIDINSKTYKLYYDDDSLQRYQQQAKKYEKEGNKHLKKKNEIPNMTEAQRKELEKQGKAFQKDFIESFYGKGSYEELYEASGRSMLQLVPLVEYTFQWLEGKVPDLDQKKKAYYTKKRKK